MSFETSKLVLKVFGVISVILGALGVLIGLLICTVATGMYVNPALGDANDFAFTIVPGVFVLVVAVIALIQGILSIRGAKDSSKIMPAWVFAIVSLVFGVAGLALTISARANGLLGSVVGVIIDCVVFYAANIIKNNREN